MKSSGKIVLENISFLKDKFNLEGTEIKRKTPKSYTRLFDLVKILVNKVLKLPQLVKSISQAVTAVLKLMHKQIENNDLKTEMLIYKQIENYKLKLLQKSVAFACLILDQ